MSMTVPPRLVAALLAAFVAVVLAQDALRSDVSEVEHWVSHLSLGPDGWVNIAALTLAGLATLALRRPVRDRSGRRWSGRWITVAGVGLVLAGVFVSDAPPGTRYDEAVTWHGVLHEVGGGLTFVGLIATCLVTRRMLSHRWGLLAAVVLAVAWVGASVMAGISYADGGPALPSGIAERVALFTGIAWLIALGLHLHQEDPERREA
ncbi:MAG TPA: DUF998 domain-containing protein [Marmoricola sp.]|nr:DUF998 domain-containing protein [Marmoricola sp.]